MELKNTAESIVRELNNLDLRTKTVQKIAFSYPKKQVEIVLNHLRYLLSSSSRTAITCGYYTNINCLLRLEDCGKHCPRYLPPAELSKCGEGDTR